MQNLSVLHERGEGVPRDELRARALRDEAGYPSSFRHLVWPDGSPYTPDLALNPLRFANRARCGADSKDPADSVFLLMDSYNAGKVAHSLGKATGQDPQALSALAQEEFRLAVTRMSTRIIDLLLAGKLPLLPEDAGKMPLAGHDRILSACGERSACPEFNAYLEKIWENARSASPTPWMEIDRFDSDHFMARKSERRWGCYYLRQFSSLQGHLLQSEPDRKTLEEIASAGLSRDQYVANCFDRGLGSRYAMIQLDLLNLKSSWFMTTLGFEQGWNQQGFAFWRSLKTYLAWAWRYRQEDFLEDRRFATLFASIPLEESVLFTPNGCRSVSVPRCDADYLSDQTLRELAKGGNAKPDSALLLPQGPEQDLLENPHVAVNEDILGIGKSESSGDWLKDFRTRLSAHRGILLRKLDDALGALRVVSRALDAKSVIADIERRLSAARAVPDGGLLGFRYLCGEFFYATHRDFGFLNADFQLLQKMRPKSAGDSLSAADWESYHAYFGQLVEGVNGICDRLEREGIWRKQPEDFSRDGFHDWYKEALSIQGTQPRIADSNATPILSLGGQAVCFDGLDCARLYLKSMIDLRAIQGYAEAFTATREEVASPALFNPYAERVACGTYDPWFKTKAAVGMLAADLANTALFGAGPIPAYAVLELKPGEVTSFKKLVEDGKVVYAGQGKKVQVNGALVGDFSMWGVPCVVSVGNTTQDPITYYLFNGVSVGACVRNDEHSLKVDSSSQISGQSGHIAGCASCYLDFIAVAGAAALAPASQIPVIKGAVYLFRGLVRFYENMNDPVDVPRLREVDINQVVEARNSFGEIPRECVSSLTRGKRCLRSGGCEARVRDLLEKRLGGKVTQLDLESWSGSSDERTGLYRVTAKSTVCEGSYSFWLHSQSDCQGYSTDSWKATGDCALPDRRMP